MGSAKSFKLAILIFFLHFRSIHCCSNFKAQWTKARCSGYFADNCYSSGNQIIEVSNELKRIIFKCRGKSLPQDVVKCINVSSIIVLIFEDCSFFTFNMKHLLEEVPTEQIHLIFSTGVQVNFGCNNIISLKRFHIYGSKTNPLFNHTFKGNMDAFVSLEVINHGYKRFQGKPFNDLSALQKLIFNNGELNRLRAEDFIGLNSLKILNFSNNKITKLGYDVFRELTSLSELDLTGNNIRSFVPEHFQYASQLTVLRLGETNLTQPPTDLLQRLSSLLELDIHGNSHILGFLAGFFRGNPKLKMLNISECSLVQLEEVAIRYATYSKTLDGEEMSVSKNTYRSLDIPNKFNSRLRFSNLSYLLWGIEKNTFLKGFVSLKKLDLSRNSLTVIRRGSFDDLRSLEELYLSHNPLKSIPPSDPFGPSRVLKILKVNNCSLKESIKFNLLREGFVDVIDLSSNKIKEVVTLPINSNARTKIALNNNRIHTILIDRRLAQCKSNYRATYDVRNNKFNCSCALREFVNFLREDENGKVFIEGNTLKCVKTKDIVKDMNLGSMPCPLQCFIKCKCMTNFMNCYGANLTDVPPNIPPGVKTLNFSNNDIKTLSNTDPEYWKDATALYISHNLLETIDDWEFPLTFQILAVNGNRLTSLPPSLMKFINETANFSLYLAENNWICDCSTIQLKEWFMMNIAKIKDAEKVRCSLHYLGTTVSAKLVTVSKEHFICVSSLAIIVFHILFLTIAFLVLAMPIFIYYFRFTIFSLLHSRNLLCSSLRNKGMEMKYDSFLCFNPTDQDVVDDLIREMEPPYKFCLPDRDWSSRFGIHKNIVQSILNSRTTLLLISKNSVSCLWFMVKYRCAYNQMIEDNMHKLIVLTIGDIGDIKDSNDDLKRFIASQPNIKWGEKWFREKLNFALSYQ